MYLVEAGNAGYGSPAQSLLTATGGTISNGNWTNVGSNPTSDQFIPTGTYGLLADANGAYNLSGDYTCDVGRVVYLIGYGGSPTFPASNPSLLLATAAGASTVVSDGTHALYTYTTTATENYYIGEAVTTSNFGNGSSSYSQSGMIADPGSSTQTVVYGGTTYAATLTTTQFSIYTTTSLAAGIYSDASQAAVSPAPSVAVTPVFNPAAVNVAVLGVCPSTGTFASRIKYIYMNEVSTAAWAYAFNQFANWSGTEQGAGSAGNNEYNIGAPATTQAQQALVNAAYAANNLYDIQGGNLSTSYAGEGHIARSQTPSGAGIVPQAELNTLANILAACVDSNNTYRAGAGAISPQCKTLQQYAQDNGVYDTTSTAHQAFNNAQAILNIAHHPQGAGTGTTSGGVQTVTPGTATSAANFVKALYALPTGNVPFTPNLLSTGAGQPNDFSIGINWQTSPYALSGTAPAIATNNSTSNTGSTANLTSVAEVAIDSLGNAWVMNNTQAARLLELTPTGYYTVYGPNYYDSGGTTPIAGLAIDTNNNVFVSATAGVMEYTAANYNANTNGTGAIGYTSGNGAVTYNSGQLAVEASGNNLYIANLNQANPAASGAGDGNSQLVKIAATPGANTAQVRILGGSALQNTASSCASYLGYVTLDQYNSVWTSNQNIISFPYASICRFDNVGTFNYSYTLTRTSAVGIGHSIAIDSGNNAWIADSGNNNLIEIGSGATSLVGFQGAATTYTAASALKAPTGIAVDGNNTIWVSNAGNGSIAQFSDAGVLVSPTYYVGSGFDTAQNCSSQCTPSAQYAIIDQAGNLWSSDIAHGEVIEWIGVAAPTVQPYAQQRAGTVAGNGHGIGQMP